MDRKVLTVGLASRIKGKQKGFEDAKVGPRGQSRDHGDVPGFLFSPTKHLCCGMQGSQCLCMVCCLRLNEEGGLHLLGNLQLTS